MDTSDDKFLSFMQLISQVYVQQELHFEDENEPCVTLPYGKDYQQASFDLGIDQLLGSDIEVNTSSESDSDSEFNASADLFLND